MTFFKKIFTSREQESRATLSKRVQAMPQDPQARQKLGLYLLQQGEVVEGVDQLARAAVLYEKSGFTGKSIAILRQMLKHDPANLDLHRWLIRLLAQEGLTGDAQRELEKVAAGGIRFVTDEKKIEFLRLAAEAMPKNPLPPILIADVLLSQRRFYDAATELERAAGQVVPFGLIVEFGKRMTSLASHGGENPDLVETCGFLWLRAGRTGEAVPLLSRAAAAQKRTGDEKRAAAAEKVLTALREGRDEALREAVSFLDALARLEAPPPAAPEPPSREATAADAAPPSAAAGAERSPSAAEAGATTLRIHPPDPAPSAPAQPAPGGRTAEDDRLVQSVVERLQAKVNEEIGDSDPEARYNLGIAYKEMGLLDEALQEFRIARRRRSLFLGASYLLAETLAEKGEFGQAIGTLDEVLASEGLGGPETRDVLYQKALILTRFGKEEDGLSIFRDLYERFPDYRDVRGRVESRKP